MATKRKRHWRWRDHVGEFNPGLSLAIEAAGGTITELARLLNVRPQAVSQWDKIPVARILDVERATKVKREKLRPDLYRRRAANGHGRAA